MWTNTDIPPGGEGKIEITFDTRHKRGNQTKTITVTSNDPASPTTTLTVTASVVVDFAFEVYNVSFGRILPEQSLVKTATLLIREPEKVHLAEVTTESEYLTAEVIPSTTPGRIDVKITTRPGIPIGFFSPEIIARAKEASIPEARISVTATVLGNIEADPPNLRYNYLKAKPSSKYMTQTVVIKSTRETGRFNILSVDDPDKRLTLKLDTVTAGSAYKITATLEPGVIDAGNARGNVLVHTDEPTQNVLSIPYSIIVNEQ